MRPSRLVWKSASSSFGVLNSERTAQNRGSPPRQYFPIKNRIIDRRIDGFAATNEAQITMRRNALRTEVDTCAVRQVNSRGRPTHFLALRLPERCTLRSQAAKLHEEIVFSHPRHSAVLVQPARLHVTLSTFQLDESSIGQSSKFVINSAFNSFGKTAFRLQFRGMGTFDNGRVVFARVHSCSEAYRLDLAVRNFRSSVTASQMVRLNSNSQDGFVPHVTLAKIRSDQIAEFGRNIPISLWCDFQHHNFGDVSFNQIDLCEMKGDAATGYYKVVESFTL